MRFAAIFGRAVIILLLSGLFGATLIWMAPGFGTDEQQLDARLSTTSVEALRTHNPGNPIAFYTQFLGRLVRGDAGTSVLFGQPVAALIRERASTTASSVAIGWAIAWTLAFLLGAAVAVRRHAGAALASTIFNGTLLSVPSAVLATVCLLLALPPAAAIAAVVFPRVFPYLFEQLRDNANRPHVIMARARGVAGVPLFFRHVVPGVLGGILGVAGVSIAFAFGASIPVEALADSPGLGQLAWRAALARDLPVLVAITLLLTTVTVLVNMLSDVAARRFGAPAR